MTVATICKHCGAMVVPSDEHACEGVLQAKRRDYERRDAKRIAHGRYTNRSRTVAHAAIHRDGCCRDCGTTTDLTAHLDPGFAGDHNAATIDDLTTLCRRCHGRRDG